MQAFSTDIGGWEVHTKGFGSKMLKKCGWEKGKPIGKRSSGLIEPLNFENYGQFDGRSVKLIKTEKQIIEEKKNWVIKQLDKLLLDSDDKGVEKEEKTVKRPPLQCRLGSLSGPLVWI